MGPKTTQWVDIRPTDYPGLWDIGGGNLGRRIGQADSIKALEDNVAAALRSQEMRSPVLLGQILADRDQPVSNLAKIARFIQSASIELISDSYIDNKTFANLADIASLGVSISPTLRILSSQSAIKQKTSGHTPSLTHTFYEHFKLQNAENVQFRLWDNNQRNHDRLILLNDGRLISPDFSLNNIGHRGTVNTITNSQGHKEWLESTWQSGVEVDWPQ